MAKLLRVVGPSDIQPVHLILERGALKTQKLGGTAGSGNPAGCSFQRMDDRLTFGVFERRALRPLAARSAYDGPAVQAL